MFVCHSLPTKAVREVYKASIQIALLQKEFKFDSVLYIITVEQPSQTIKYYVILTVVVSL